MLNTYSMAQNLQGDYRRFFQQAVNMANLQDKNLRHDEKLVNLFDVLAKAQRENRSLESVVGTNHEEFLTDYFAAIKQYEGWHILFANIFYKTFLIVGMATLFFCLTDIGLGWGTLSRTDNVFIYLGLLATVMIFNLTYSIFIRRWMMRSKNFSIAKYYASVIIFFLIALALIYFISGYVKLPVKRLYILITCVTYLAIYLLVRSIARLKDHGNIFAVSNSERIIRREQKDRNRIFDREVRDIEDYSSYVDALTANYNRINSRRTDSGKEPLTLKEFEKIIARRGLFTKIVVIVLLGIMAVTLVWQTIRYFAIGPVSTALLCTFLLVMVCLIVYKLFIRILIRSIIIPPRIIRDCISNDLSLNDFNDVIKLKASQE